MAKRRPQDHRPSKEEQDRLYREATAAAQDGRIRSVFVCLCKAGYFANFAEDFTRRWPSLSEADVDDAVCKAVDSLVKAVREGRKIDRVPAYLWKACQNGCERRSRHRQVPLLDHHHAEDEGGRAVWKPEALAKIRELVDRLPGNQQVVWKAILEAMAQGTPDLSNEDLAQITGLSEGNVRTSKCRGRQRLVALAKAAGLTASDFKLDPLGEEEEEDDEEEDEGDGR